MALGWPEWLVPRHMSWHIENASRSGGVATNGQEQVIGSMSGRWVVSLLECPVRTDDEVLGFRALMTSLRGRSGTIVVPAFDRQPRQNWPVDPYDRVLSPENVRRTRLDGTIYQDPRIPAQSQITATFTAAAARRATTVSLAVTAGAPIKVGQYFSPRLGKMHMITEALGGNQYRIEPPLRLPEASGAPIDLVNPSCEMRLADDDAGRIELQYGRYGFVTLNLVEAF
jgi:hypothetical protein